MINRPTFFINHSTSERNGWFPPTVLYGIYTQWWWNVEGQEDHRASLFKSIYWLWSSVYFFCLRIYQNTPLHDQKTSHTALGPRPGRHFETAFANSLFSVVELVVFCLVIHTEIIFSRAPSETRYDRTSNSRLFIVANYTQRVQNFKYVCPFVWPRTTGVTAAKGKGNKKALLSQRRPRDAPNMWVPWKVSRVLANAPGYVTRNL